MSTSSSYTANMESSIFGAMSNYSNLVCGTDTEYCSWATSQSAAQSQYSEATAPMEMVTPTNVETPMSSEIAQALGYTSKAGSNGEVDYSLPSSGLTTNTVTPGSVIPQGESLSTIQSEDKLDAELQFYKLFGALAAGLLLIYIIRYKRQGKTIGSTIIINRFHIKFVIFICILTRIQPTV